MSTTPDGVARVAVLLYQFGGDGWASFQELKANEGRVIRCEIKGLDRELHVGEITRANCYAAALAGLVEVLDDCFRLSYGGRETVGELLERLFEREQMADFC